MTFGYLISIAVFAVLVVAALWPARRPPLNMVSFFLGMQINELPFVAFLLVHWTTLQSFLDGDLSNPVGRAGLGLSVLVTLGLVEIVRRQLLAGPALERALDRELGSGWRRNTLDVYRRTRPRSRNSSVFIHFHGGQFGGRALVGNGRANTERSRVSAWF